MDTTMTGMGAAVAAREVLGLSYEMAQGLSLLLFVLSALLFLLVVMAVMKRRARGENPLPGPGIVLLAIGLVSFFSALLLKVM